MPIQESGQLQFINTKDAEEWLPNIAIRYVYGHTEAMMLPQISYKDKTILYCADLMPSVAHIALPWVMGYDMRPLETLKEKKSLLQEAVEKNMYLYFEHDAVNELCSLQQTEKGIKYQERFTLNDIL